jgi:glycosyltransferase involved in cell wall biosynthesis
MDVNKAQSLRVCLASMAPIVGGAEVAAERLARGLVDAGHDVVVLLGTRGLIFDRMQQVGVHCVHTPMYFTDKRHWLRYWLARRALRKLLIGFRPDVLHSNDLTTHQIASDAARGLGVPRICHHRFCYEPGFTKWLSKFGAERHLFVSRALMAEIVAQGHERGNAPREVVYDGLPLPPLPTAAARLQARAELDLPADQTVVTFAGQIIPRKGVADLVRAWAVLAPQVRKGAALVIVGDDLEGGGKHRIEMEQLARTSGVEAKFVGFQKNVGKWLLASDIAVVPSHAEPLGNATLEAMSYGLPVVGSAVGGIPEMIVPEKTGLLVPSADPPSLGAALSRLIVDRDLRDRLGAAGRQRCESAFSLKAHVESVVVQYRRALARSNSSRLS